MKTKKVKKVKPTDNLIKFAYYVEGYSLRELGKLFGVSRETIRKRLGNIKSKKLQV